MEQSVSPALLPALWAAQVDGEDSPFAQVKRYPSPRSSAKGGGRCAFCAPSFSIITSSNPANIKEGQIRPRTLAQRKRLEELGYVIREPDPTDRRAKLIVLTDSGRAAVEAGKQTIVGLEARITEILGRDGHEFLREMPTKLLEEG